LLQGFFYQVSPQAKTYANPYPGSFDIFSEYPSLQEYPVIPDDEFGPWIEAEPAEENTEEEEWGPWQSSL
jgi:hypothetical protein